MNPVRAEMVKHPREIDKSATHPHGIKVRLESGAVGRVKKVT
jgi:uncharacterized repeat protein (TIGR03833 family)